MPDQMIRKLIEIDKSARQKVEAVQKEKDNLEEFLATARRTLLREETEKTETAIREALAKGEGEKVEKTARLAFDFDVTMKNLESRYADNRDAWIDSLFQACLE